MKELLGQYAEYNVWANNKMIDVMLKPEDGFVDHEIISSFPSIRSTVYHCWSAEYIWLQRLQLVENPLWIAGEFSGTFEDACREWKTVSDALVQFTKRQYDDKAFTHVVQYYDRAKVSYKTPVYEVLHHVFNHSTYHRGQLVTMLRQLALKEIPATDFIAFTRKK
jgi:uncharacterized damage-inducible protein DinB